MARPAVRRSPSLPETEALLASARAKNFDMRMRRSEIEQLRRYAWFEMDRGN